MSRTQRKGTDYTTDTLRALGLYDSGSKNPDDLIEEAKQAILDGVTPNRAKVYIKQVEQQVLEARSTPVEGDIFYCVPQSFWERSSKR